MKGFVNNMMQNNGATMVFYLATKLSGHYYLIRGIK